MGALAFVPAALGTAPAAHTFRIARVVDGDTVYLTNGAKVRLVQIDTPEVFFGVECWGREASAETKKLLPVGTAVRLTGSGRRTASTATAGGCATWFGCATG